jgi:hypothetical protein
MAVALQVTAMSQRDEDVMTLNPFRQRDLSWSGGAVRAVYPFQASPGSRRLTAAEIVIFYDVLVLLEI